MPKTPSTKLFNLIKSLSGSEKRYFKVFVSNRQSDKDSKYIRLFDAIEEQKELNEEALKKLIYADQPIESRKYSELKAYLYDLILKSLHGYDEKTSIDFRLKNLLQNVRVLYKRSHYPQCIEMLEKAKKLAYKYENFISVVEVLSWEKQVAYAQENIEFLDSQLDRIDKEEQDCLEQVRNISTYRNILYQLIISRRKDAVLRSELKVRKLEAIISNPVLENVAQAKTHRARILYYRIYSNYTYSILAYQDFYEYSLQLVELMETRKDLLREDISGYIFAMTNLMLACGLLGKYSELENYLEHFKQIKPKTLDDELRVFKFYNSLKFRLCIVSGEFEEGQTVLKKHLREAKKFDPQSFERGSFYFQYFYIYFGIEDYEKALEFLNQWLNLPRSVEREDLQSLARILNLIIHYEMDNSILLEYLIRSTYRFLKKRNRVFEFEKQILTFIQKAIKIQSKKELKKAFQNLKEDFEKLSQIPSEKVMLQYFDIISWVDSKILDQPFSEVLKARFQDKHSN